MKRAVVIGASGQIGRPVVEALTRDGWAVTAASRGGGRDAGWDEGVRTVRLDRADDAALAAVVGDACDLVVDVVAYDAAHARQLTALAGRIGSAVVISSVSVYEDGAGRGFDTQDRPDGFPRYPLPVPETQPTVAAGEESYSTRKAAMERELLAPGGDFPVTVLRPGAVHGPYSPLPRELYFVKRNLDGRERRVLAYRGESRFHSSGARNIAELVRLAAARPGSRVLNACDAEAPTVAGIGAAIDAVMGVETRTTCLDGPPAGSVGLTPWSVPLPVVYDMSAAERELGYRPVVSYAESLPETVGWLTGALRGQDWRERFPLLARACPDLFDYAAEDAWHTA
ncbi:NAD-dependent epimerase/dehydratase family protein [Streptomyces actinomycinicus]|uniref:NAD-dependent epimerase/dehydratase family protein n=1 Tax=Streptomyces actinomycinicus TaxID=1695166 RepID=A0A937EIU8_9ACTN|nr:NAD-dependent epimerase/dehydratase family protein [Streptomyces actinomycinicus]MBL1082909.1 NAD-dependent epimerase/dehydratase family protein [Streptomyces actinomycinicus]